MKMIRFWEYVNGMVKISLKENEEKVYRTYDRTEDGMDGSSGNMLKPLTKTDRIYMIRAHQSGAFISTDLKTITWKGFQCLKSEQNTPKISRFILRLNTTKNTSPQKIANS